MERIPVTNTSYDDSSVPRPDTPPVFTESEIEKAQPVIPLGPRGWLAKVRGQWNAVTHDRQQRRLLAAVVAFGLIGGIVGGVTAARNADPQPADQIAASADVAADNQNAPEEVNKPNANETTSELATVAEDSQPVAVVPEAPVRKASSNSATRRTYMRSAPGERKAYRFAVIYGDSDITYRGKRGRKHHD